MNDHKRTFDPHAQLAGAVANSSTSLSAPQMLQVKATTQSYFVTAQWGWSPACRPSESKLRRQLQNPGIERGQARKKRCVRGEGPRGRGVRILRRVDVREIRAIRQVKRFEHQPQTGALVDTNIAGEAYVHRREVRPLNRVASDVRRPIGGEVAVIIGIVVDSRYIR